MTYLTSFGLGEKITKYRQLPVVSVNDDEAKAQKLISVKCAHFNLKCGHFTMHKTADFHWSVNIFGIGD